MLFLSPFVNHNLEMTELECILQSAMDTPILEKILEKDETGDFQTPIIVANKLIPEDVHISFQGVKMRVVEKKEDVYDSESTFVVTSYDVSKERVRMQLKYNGDSKVSVRADKREGAWVLKRLSIKGSKGMWFYSDWGNS